jgi:hypothetical protein
MQGSEAQHEGQVRTKDLPIYSVSLVHGCYSCLYLTAPLFSIDLYFPKPSTATSPPNEFSTAVENTVGLKWMTSLRHHVYIPWSLR